MVTVTIDKGVVKTTLMTLQKGVGSGVSGGRRGRCDRHAPGWRVCSTGEGECCRTGSLDKGRNMSSMWLVAEEVSRGLP